MNRGYLSARDRLANGLGQIMRRKKETAERASEWTRQYNDCVCEGDDLADSDKSRNITVVARNSIVNWCFYFSFQKNFKFNFVCFYRFRHTINTNKHWNDSISKKIQQIGHCHGKDKHIYNFIYNWDWIAGCNAMQSCRQSQLILFKIAAYCSCSDVITIGSHVPPLPPQLFSHFIAANEHLSIRHFMWLFDRRINEVQRNKNNHKNIFTSAAFAMSQLEIPPSTNYFHISSSQTSTFPSGSSCVISIWSRKNAKRRESFLQNYIFFPFRFCQSPSPFTLLCFQGRKGERRGERSPGPTPPFRWPVNTPKHLTRSRDIDHLDKTAALFSSF